MNYDEIQKHINRSMPSIYNKVFELGLSSKDNKYKKLKYNQRQFIINNCHRMTDQELADMFGVHYETIANLRYKNGIKKKSNNNYKRKTQPERLVDSILSKLNLNYEFNSFLNGYYPDFLIEGEAVIEVQGDYFHCNPRLYPNGPNETQIDFIVKDYYKKCFYLGNNIPVLYIWEHDILNDTDSIEKEIINFCRPFKKLEGSSMGKIGESCDANTEVTSYSKR